jgi:hypothetical protein
MSYANDAIARVKGYLVNYDTDQPAEILADIIHYCREMNIDLEYELDLAEQYVDEELSTDEELQ